jgi:hypothetical protein
VTNQYDLGTDYLEAIFHILYVILGNRLAQFRMALTYPVPPKIDGIT